MGAEQIDFAIADNDIGFFQIGAAGADGLHFPAVQLHACLVTLFDEVVVEDFFVVNNAHVLGKSRRSVKISSCDSIKWLIFNGSSA